MFRGARSSHCSRFSLFLLAFRVEFYFPLVEGGGARTNKRHVAIFSLTTFRSFSLLASTVGPSWVDQVPWQLHSWRLDTLSPRP